MKKMIALCAALFSIQLAVASTDTLVVRIKGMRCEECAHKVGTVLKKDKGVNGFTFDLEKRTVKVAYNSQQTCVDSIKAKLAATGRYKSSPYSPTEVIRRGMALQMADMHCQKCANRIMNRVQQVEGVDSIAPHVDTHYVFFRYDANRTSKNVIREILLGMGFTPVNYYTSKNIDYAYFTLPAAQANEETIEAALALDGVDDANVNAKRKSLAITYVNTETTAEKLLQELKAAGIDAVVPPAHQCDEKEKK
jgi:copper ion binding protein